MISVCIAVHNGSLYIIEQIGSILHQLKDNDEIIISDDGSTDETLKLIRSINDTRIKIVSFTQHIDFKSKKLASYYYASANFINALRYAKGDYIFLSDQDDRWHCNKVSECIKAFDQYDIISHNFALMNSSGHIEDTKYLKKIPNNNIGVLKATYQLPFRGCCLAFKKPVLDHVWPMPQDVFLHDCYIGLHAVCHGFRFGFIDQSLIDYRRHSTNVSSLAPNNSFWFKVAYRIKMLIQIYIAKRH